MRNDFTSDGGFARRLDGFLTVGLEGPGVIITNHSVFIDFVGLSALFIEIDGRRYLWRDVLATRHAQLVARKKAEQPALFELRDDSRPATERSAVGRYGEPSPFAYVCPIANRSAAHPAGNAGTISSRPARMLASATSWR